MMKKIFILSFLFLLAGTAFSTDETIDVTKPTVSFLNLENGDILKGTIMIKVEARDGSWTVCPESTAFYLNNKILTGTNGKQYAERIDTTHEYQMEINTKEFEDGEYKLKVKTMDRAFNTEEKTIKIIIQNRYDFEGKTIEMKEQMKEINTLFAKFEGYGLDCSDAEADRTAMEKRLQEAIDAGENEEVFIAKEKLVGNLYTKIKNKLVLSDTIRNCTTNENSEKITLIDYDLKDISAKRVISFYNAKAGEKEIKVANFKITAKNESNEIKTIKIVEEIPKEFANSASLISSDIKFTVIEDDPIIMWEIQLNPNEQKEITYSINNGGYTDEQINNAETIFNTKPAVFESSFEISKTLFTKSIETISITSTQSPITGLFSVVGVANQSGILNIIAVILGIALVAFAFTKFPTSEKTEDEKRKFAYRGKNK